MIHLTKEITSFEKLQLVHPDIFGRINIIVAAILQKIKKHRGIDDKKHIRPQGIANFKQHFRSVVWMEFARKTVKDKRVVFWVLLAGEEFKITINEEEQFTSLDLNKTIEYYNNL